LKHSQQSATYLDFKASLEDFVNTNYDKTTAETLLAKIDWDAWVKAPGANPPGNGLNFETEGAVAFEYLADNYIALGGDGRPDNYTAYNLTDDP
jgi:hypothetical protein